MRIRVRAAFLIGAFLANAQAESVWHRVSWTTSDGVQLAGEFIGPSRVDSVTWIFLHGLGSTRDEWRRFAARVGDGGDGVLIYNARGPGSPWDRMVDDLDSAVQMLRRQHGIDPSRIGVAGASLGANVALVYAGRNPGVRAGVLLSPGLDYAGVQTESAFKQYGKRPLLLAASPGDAYAYQTARFFAARRMDPALKIMAGEGSAHGVNMLKAPFAQELLDWMQKQRWK